MTSDTIQNYFLRAGAAFRRSAEWAKEFLDEQGRPRVIRAGRFGIGAFAVFLLGPSFRLWTRHAGVDQSMGYTIEASANSELIEIWRDSGLHIGTTIEAEISGESAKALELETEKYSNHTGPMSRIDWFCWDWPKVVKRVMRGPTPELLDQRHTAPLRKSKLSPEWSVIHPEGFDAVYWTFGDSPRLSCNGLKVADPEKYWGAGAEFSWPKETQLKPPYVAVLDSAANLPLTTQRYGLSQQTVPFIGELARDVILSFIAHALVCGPTSRAEALSLQRGHPLRTEFSEYGESYHSGFGDNTETPFSLGHLRWCMTSAEVVPADPWFYTLLSAESCLVYGALGVDERFLDRSFAKQALMDQSATTGHAILSWNGIMRVNDRDLAESAAITRRVADLPAWILSRLAIAGVTALGHEVEASHVLVSARSEYDFETPAQGRQNWFYDDMSPEFEILKEIRGTNSRRPCFEARKGILTPSIPLQTLLEAIEVTRPSNDDESRHRRREPTPDVLFVAEIKTRLAERAPKSLVARIWNECLGPKAIPFDAAARATLIADGCKHPELKRHIEAWQEMKRTGSKWIAGK